MIFHWIYVRRFKRLFGAYIPNDKIDEMFSDLHEWSAFRLLTDRWNPFVVRDPDKEYDALIQLQVMIQRALKQSENEDRGKHSNPSLQRTGVPR